MCIRTGFNADPEPAFKVHADPEPVPDPNTDPGFYGQKLQNIATAGKRSYFVIKITVYLSLGLHEGRSSYRRNLKPSKVYLKNFNFFKT